VKKACCDRDRYREYTRDRHEAAFELIGIQHVRQSGANTGRSRSAATRSRLRNGSTATRRLGSMRATPLTRSRSTARFWR
jgi:hypothetical protein